MTGLLPMVTAYFSPKHLSIHPSLAGKCIWQRVGCGWGARKAMPARTVDIRTRAEFGRTCMFFRCAAIPSTFCVPQTFFPTPCSRTRRGAPQCRRLIVYPLSIRSFYTHTGFPPRSGPQAHYRIGVGSRHQRPRCSLPIR